MTDRRDETGHRDSVLFSTLMIRAQAQNLQAVASRMSVNWRTEAMVVHSRAAWAPPPSRLLDRLVTRP
jgi:hypothetical protein